MTWRTDALEALRKLAASGDEFTSDDLDDLVGVPDGSHGANAGNNLIGALFAQAHREGWIQTDGRVVPSRLPRRHRSAVRVWRGTPQQGLF